MRVGIPQTSDRGAVAIVVAISALVLFGVGAMAVDLGNGYARERDVQSQADLAALAGGGYLPVVVEGDKSAIIDEVVDYLNHNQPQSDNQECAPTESCVTASNLTNADPNDGQLIFAPDGTWIQVITPLANVRFGIASAIGFESMDVVAAATAALQSPIPVSNVFPFVVPDSCPFGPGIVDTNASGKVDTTGPSWTPEAELGSTRDPSMTITIDPTEYEELSTDATVTLKNLPPAIAGARVDFRIGATAKFSVSFTFTEPTTNSDKNRTASIAVPDDVVATPGTWNVWAAVGPTDALVYSKNPASYTVPGAPAATSSVSCAESENGSYGQMYSPRNNQAPDQTGFALNVALGLDHLIYPWSDFDADTYEDCGQKQADPPSGGVQDEVVAADEVDALRPNCVLSQGGNDGPYMYQGLVSGVGDVPGRLDSKDTSDLCAHGNDESETPYSLNNDLLSCYLDVHDKYVDETLEWLTVDTSNMPELLDPSIVDSPRFVWLPVVWAFEREDIKNNIFYAVKRFVPGFITNEAPTAKRGDAPISPNGVWINSGNSVEAIQVFTFHPSALPVDERAPTTDYDPLMQRRLVLID